jgi:predicted metalloprotease with PDZ domain
VSFTNFWAKYVNGTDDIEYAKYLAYAGVDIVNENEGKNTPYLGVTTVRGASKVLVASVTRGSGAWNGGINVNDEIVAIDGVPAEMMIERMTQITGKNVGDVIKVSVVRDGLKKELDVTLTASDVVKFKTNLNPNATPLQLAVRKRWMGI